MNDRDNLVDITQYWFKKQREKLGTKTEEELAEAIVRVSEKIRDLEKLMEEIREEYELPTEDQIQDS